MHQRGVYVCVSQVTYVALPESTRNREWMLESDINSCVLGPAQLAGYTAMLADRAARIDEILFVMYCQKQRSSGMGELLRRPQLQLASAADSGSAWLSSLPPQVLRCFNLCQLARRTGSVAF
jgi:hypothetical protein